MHVQFLWPLTDGGYWRIPLLFLASGYGLMTVRKLGATYLYIVKSLLFYVLVWNAIYLLVLRKLLPGLASNYVDHDFALNILTTRVITGHGHAISLLGPTWFLIILATGLAIAATLVTLWQRNAVWSLVVGAALVGGAWSMVPNGETPWFVWLGGMTVFAAGHIVLGHGIFSSRWSSHLADNRFALLSLVAAVWISTSQPDRWFIPSSYRGDHNGLWSFVQMLCFLSPALVIGRALARVRLLAHIGGRSKHIMTHHLAGFALVDGLFVLLGFMPLSEMRPYNGYQTQVYWPLYVTVGTVFALSVGWVSDRVWRTILRQFERLKSFRSGAPA